MGLTKFYSHLWFMLWVPDSALISCFKPVVAEFSVVQRIINRKFNTQYIFPWLFVTYLTMDNFYYRYTVGYNPENQILFGHCVVWYLPPFLRAQNEFAASVGIYCQFVVYFMLIFDRMPHISKLLLFPVDGGIRLRSIEKEINPALSSKITSFWNRVGPKLNQIPKMMELAASISYTFPFVGIEIYNSLTNADYSINYRYWFCAVVSVFFIHGTMEFVHFGNMFVVANLVMHIKQKFYLNSIDKQQKTYRGFNRVLKALLRHCEEITMLNAFFSKNITVNIIFASLVGSSLMNGAIILSGGQVPWYFLVSWYYFAVVTNLCNLIYTSTSGLTINYNRKLYLKLITLQCSICKLEIIKYSRQIVHLDLANEYKSLLLKSSFRLAAFSTVLNNKFYFFTLMGVVSLVYMKTFGK